QYNEGTSTYSAGDPNLTATMQTSGDIPQYRSGYKKVPWEAQLVIAARAREFGDAGDERKQAVARGVLVHRILSEVTDAASLESTVNKFVFEGLIAGDEKAALLA